MNSLHLDTSGCFCSPEAYAALASLNKARVLICSDTHGHYDVFEAIIRKFGASCDVLVFSGDGMWDVVQCIENAYESAAFRQQLPSVIVFVSGNGDGDTYRILLEKPITEVEISSSRGSSPSIGISVSVPLTQTLTVCGSTLFVTHGHQHSVEVTLEMLVAASHISNASIAIYGHTHIPFAKVSSDVFVINPGSPARPRGDSLPSCAILSLDISKKQPNAQFFSVKETLHGAYVFDDYYVERN